MSKHDPAQTSARGNADTIVRDAAVRRTFPRFYLLDERGRMIAWPATAGSVLDPVVQALVDLYFSQPPPERGVFSELIELDAKLHSIRIAPYREPQRPRPEARFALIVDAFTARLGDRRESADLSAAR